MNFKEIQENMDEIHGKEKSKHGMYTLSNRVIGSDLRNNDGLQVSDAYGKKRSNLHSARNSVARSVPDFPEPIKQLKLSPSVTAMYTEYRQ